MYEDDVKRAGGIANADRQGGRKRPKGVQLHEAAAIATFYSSDRCSAAVELANGTVIQQLSDAADEVVEYGIPYPFAPRSRSRLSRRFPEVRAWCSGPAYPQESATSSRSAAKLRKPRPSRRRDRDAAWRNDGFVGQKEAVDPAEHGRQRSSRVRRWPSTSRKTPPRSSTSAPSMIPPKKRNVYDAEAQLAILELHGTDKAETPDPLKGAVRVFDFASNTRPSIRRMCSVSRSSPVPSPSTTPIRSRSWWCDHRQHRSHRDQRWCHHRQHRVGPRQHQGSRSDLTRPRVRPSGPSPPGGRAPPFP